MGNTQAADLGEGALEALAYSPLFFDFSLDELAAITRGLEVATFADGEALTEEGEPSDCLYILLSGQVVTSFGKPDERRLTLIHLHPPEIIGEVGLILNTPRSANTHAVGPVQAVRLPRQQFHRLMLQKPQFSLSILRTLAARVERTNRQMALLHADPSATISDIDLEALSAAAAEHTLFKTAQAILEHLPPQAPEPYDLAQTLDARTARNRWFEGESKAYRTAADAIIINLAIQATCERAAQRGPLGLLEATTDDGRRLTVADYLWPHNPYLSPSWRLHTRPMPMLHERDDVYRLCLLALVDTLAADTYDLISRLARLPEGTPLRVVGDFYQLTNDFSVQFMGFSRLQREESPASEGQRNNPLISLATGIETGMRIMVRLLRLAFDKFEASVGRLPTEEEIHTALVPTLRNSHQLLTMLARVNLIDVNTRNRVLMGRTDPWFDPARFEYRRASAAGDATWDGSPEQLPACRLYPSAAAVRLFEETPPAREIVRAVGVHRRTDGCPARAPLQLASEAQRLGLLPGAAEAPRKGARGVQRDPRHLLSPAHPARAPGLRGGPAAAPGGARSGAGLAAAARGSGPAPARARAAHPAAQAAARAAAPRHLEEGPGAPDRAAACGIGPVGAPSRRAACPHAPGAGMIGRCRPPWLARASASGSAADAWAARGSIACPEAQSARMRGRDGRRLLQNGMA